MCGRPGKESGRSFGVQQHFLLTHHDVLDEETGQEAEGTGRHHVADDSAGYMDHSSHHHRQDHLKSRVTGNESVT